MKDVSDLIQKVKGAELTPFELRLPEELSIEDWSRLGRGLCRLDQVVKWWLGDWAAFGIGDRERKNKDWRKYGKLKEFARANGLEYGTLANLAWVSRSVTFSRRRENVEWSKHQEVAALTDKEQEHWLAKADKEDLSRAELRRRIRRSHGENDALQPDGPIMRFMSKACDDLTHWLEYQPESFWSAERRKLWRHRLGPIVRFWETL